MTLGGMKYRYSLEAREACRHCWKPCCSLGSATPRFVSSWYLWIRSLDAILEKWNGLHSWFECQISWLILVETSTQIPKWLHGLQFLVAWLFPFHACASPCPGHHYGGRHCHDQTIPLAYHPCILTSHPFNPYLKPLSMTPLWLHH